MASKYVIYMHKNKINGMVYIGQTCQVPPSKRWNNGYGYFRNKKFFHAIVKYGWDNFDHIILESNLTLEEANYYEDYYINYFHSCERDKGYNLQYGGNNKKPSEETIEKLKKSHLGHKPTEEQKKKNSLSNFGKHNRLHTQEEKDKISKKKQKKIMCLNTNQIFNSIEEAANWCGLKGWGHIADVCNGKRKTSGKHPQTNEPLKWKFVKEDESV